MDMNYSTTPIYRKDGTVLLLTDKSPLVILTSNNWFNLGKGTMLYASHRSLDIAGTGFEPATFRI